MLCSGFLCISVSLATWLLSAMLPWPWSSSYKDTEPVLSQEDRKELQMDVQAAQICLAAAIVIVLSWLWRKCFTAEPKPIPQVPQEEKPLECLSRRPSEHKETQYQPEEGLYTTAGTQTSDCLLPAEWTSSESQLSGSPPPSECVQLSETQTETSDGVSSVTAQLLSSGAHAGGTSPDDAQLSPVQPSLLQKETTPDSVVQQIRETHTCKALQVPETLQDDCLIDSAASVQPPQSEAPANTTSYPATVPQPYDTSPRKPELPDKTETRDIAPNSLQGLGAGDLPPAELVTVREGTVQAVPNPQTVALSVAADQLPLRTMPSPRTLERPSYLPSPKQGSYAARRRCNKCLNSRPPAAGQGSTQPADGMNTNVAVPSSATVRCGGDAPQHSLGGLRLPTAGRGYPTPGKKQQAPSPTHSPLNSRPGSPRARPPPAYVYRPPFV